jgi:hypothetical protein
MLRRSTAVASVVVALGMVPVARATPAWSTTTCSAKLVAPSAYLPSTSNCGEERVEEEEEHFEEELEVREDEEEEREISAERAAGAATDAAEEATEEAQEQAGQERTTSNPRYPKATLKLRVRVLTRRGHSLPYPDETISVATGIPAQVKVVLRDRDGPVKLFGGESTKGRKYVLHVPWGCHTRSRGHTFTVTAYRESENQVGAGDVSVRRGSFTIDTPICSKSVVASR